MIERRMVMRVRIIEAFKKKKSLKKVCAYVRVSTYSQSQGESFENQVSYYERILSSNPEYEFIGVFADKGITGTKANREEFIKMLELARNGSIDIIYTKSISRFARNTVDLLEIVREMKLISVEIRFEEEKINTLSGDGELMLAVLSSFAQEESKNASDNIKWRIKKKFENGELIINTRRFLGYDKDEYGDLIINREEAKIVELIFNMYLNGYGSHRIAKELNKKNIPTVTGSRWDQTTILDIIKNEKYKGDALLQKTYTQNHLTKLKKENRGEVDSFYVIDSHPAIVTKEVWEQAQAEMKKRAEAKGNFEGNNKGQNRYPLSGMLYCSKCGATLRRRIWNSKLLCKKIVWQCSNYIKNGKDACSGTVIDDEIISRLKINEPTVVKEEIKDGKKYYSYTGKSQ
jgi:site-specific DNA recombinase